MIILETERLLFRRQVMEDLDDLWALYCNPDNLASQKVAEKIGMSPERYMDGWKGDGIPFWIYSITKTN